jgi:flavin reductase (DIM6/NTAB) family NADH-FMN oxidoreductase RutF
LKKHKYEFKGFIFNRYGVYALSANNDGDDNACIVNTVQQVTSSPLQITVAINKANRTHDMIKASGKFNVSVLTQSTPFSVIERFGFQSGKTADKFIGFDSVKRSANGVLYLSEYSNDLLSGSVTSMIDLDTHTLFADAEVTEAEVLS